jgi:hypothetical protein
MSVLLINSRDETAHNDIILHCDLHSYVILHCDVIMHNLHQGIFPTIS